MNRIELSAAHQVSHGMIEPLEAAEGMQPISCTPTVALAATVAALIVAFYGGYDANDDLDHGDSPAGRLDVLSSADLVGASRAARAGH